MLDAAAAMGEGMYQPGLTIVVPERAGIYPTSGLAQAVRSAPFPPRILGMADKNTFIWRAEADPQLAIVPANRRRPNALTRLIPGLTR